MNMGEKIFMLRKQLGLTLEDVGRAVGVGKSTVRKWENGDIANMRRDKIASLASALHTTPGYLMGWEKDDESAIASTGMVPVIGTIPAGVPILADENIEGYLPTMVKHPDEYFFLRVRGESMINAGIPSGALVLIHRQNCAEDRQIVACRVNGDEATLKRFKQVKDTIILMPENPNYQPILVNCKDFADGYAEIIGIVKQIIIEV